jgi:hypothetical protein
MHKFFILWLWVGMDPPAAAQDEKESQHENQ